MMNHVHTHRPAATPSIGIARIAGPIDFDHARETRRMLLASLAVRENLLVDMSGVTAIDSAGVASLIEIQMTARKNGKAFGNWSKKLLNKKVNELRVVKCQAYKEWEWNFNLRQHYKCEHTETHMSTTCRITRGARPALSGDALYFRALLTYQTR